MGGDVTKIPSRAHLQFSSVQFVRGEQGLSLRVSCLIQRRNKFPEARLIASRPTGARSPGCVCGIGSAGVRVESFIMMTRAAGNKARSQITTSTLIAKSQRHWCRQPCDAPLVLRIFRRFLLYTLFMFWANKPLRRPTIVTVRRYASAWPCLSLVEILSKWLNETCCLGMGAQLTYPTLCCRPKKILVSLENDEYFPLELCLQSFATASRWCCQHVSSTRRLSSLLITPSTVNASWLDARRPSLLHVG